MPEFSGVVCSREVHSVPADARLWAGKGPGWKRARWPRVIAHPGGKEKVSVKKIKKRCQEPFPMFCGRPWGRSVLFRPNFRTIRSDHLGSPKGRPRGMPASKIEPCPAARLGLPTSAKLPKARSSVKKPFFVKKTVIAVGTALSGRPPHRSVREVLPHTAPPLGQTITMHRTATCRG